MKRLIINLINLRTVEIHLVAPAKAGVQKCMRLRSRWIPACVGMTDSHPVVVPFVRYSKFHRAPYILAVSIAALFGGLLTACGAPQLDAGNSTAPAVEVIVAPAVIGDISALAAYVAKTEADHQVNLAPLGTGLIEQLNVDIGDEVEKGQIIAELSHGTLDAQLRQAQATLLGAEANLASVKADVKPNRIPAQARADAAKARLEQLIEPSTLDIQAAVSSTAKARAELESARTQLQQLKNPTEAKLAAARALVASKESLLSQAQVAVNEEINLQIALKGGARLLWEILLRSRLDLQENSALLQNLRQSFGLQLKEREIAAAERIVEQNTKLIPNVLAQIESDSAIPRDINDSLWAEAAAQAVLRDARAALKELENPTSDSITLAQNRVDVAQASLDSAIAELDLLRSPTAADLAKAEADLADAEQALIRTQDERVQYDIEAAQAAVDQAQAEIQFIQQQLLDSQVRAPFDGVVSKRWISLGAAASPQTPVVTLISRELVVSFQVEETRIKSLQKGDLVTFSSPALPVPPLEMKIDRISPGGDPQEHTFYVQLSPVEMASGLNPGVSGAVSIETTRRGVVLVPKIAVIRRGNEATLFVVRDGKAQLLSVGTGLENLDYVEIRSDIQPGEQVVVSGQERLKDGARVAGETKN